MQSRAAVETRLWRPHTRLSTEEGITALASFITQSGAFTKTGTPRSETAPADDRDEAAMEGDAEDDGEAREAREAGQSDDEDDDTT